MDDAVSAPEPDRSDDAKQPDLSAAPTDLVDLAARAGLALAAQDAAAVATVRVELEALRSVNPGAAPTAELLAAYEEAMRVQAERLRQFDAHQPVRESVLLELINRGPLAPSELVAALGVERHHIVYALHKLEGDGLIDSTAPPDGKRRPRRRYRSTTAGIAAAMGG